jgi:hypothetical protein
MGGQVPGVLVVPVEPDVAPLKFKLYCNVYTLSISLFFGVAEDGHARPVGGTGRDPDRRLWPSLFMVPYGLSGLAFRCNARRADGGHAESSGQTAATSLRAISGNMPQ